MFSYRRATEIDEAVEVLGVADDGLKVIAGGQSLLPMINLGLARPEELLDVGDITALAGTTVADGTVTVGATVRHASLERPDDTLRDAAPLLPLAARRIGHAAIRERGTFGVALLTATRVRSGRQWRWRLMPTSWSARLAANGAFRHATSTWVR